MQYELEKINALQACDDLLTRARKKKLTLERLKRNLGESIDTFRKRIDYISKESARVQTSIAALMTAYQLLPEGQEKATLHIMIKRLEVRQALLEKRAYTCNVATLLVKELRYNRLDSQVPVIERFIAAVEQRRTALSEVAVQVASPAQMLDESDGPFQASKQNILDDTSDWAYPALARKDRRFRSFQRVFSRRAANAGDGTAREATTWATPHI
jgi:hypothetical protein